MTQVVPVSPVVAQITHCVVLVYELRVLLHEIFDMAP